MFWNRKQTGPKYVIVNDGFNGYAVKRIRDGKLAWICNGSVCWEKPHIEVCRCWDSEKNCKIILARITA